VVKYLLNLLVHVTLSHRIGFGTYLAAGGDVRNGVRAALKAGIRAIDTASLYRVHQCRCALSVAEVCLQLQHSYKLVSHADAILPPPCRMKQTLRGQCVRLVSTGRMCSLPRRLRPFRCGHTNWHALMLPGKIFQGLTPIFVPSSLMVAPVVFHSKALSVPQQRWRAACPRSVDSWISC
jgi:hypothetical protein